MSVINTNITSLISQQNLSKSQNALSTAMERLSSGMRINSAKDDSAGQAIANRMSAQITGLAQAQRNANDGISLAQTAEGALNQINDNLQRVRELTVQAQNGTNSQDALDSIQNEITQRLDEIDRISEQTEFNGTKVLASDQTLKIQVGANDGQSIGVGLKKIDRGAMKLDGFNINKADVANTAANASDLTDDGFASVNGDNGTKVWSKDSTETHSAATATNALDSLVDTNSISSTATTTGLGVAATGNNYTYNATSDSFTFDATGAADSAAATYIKAAAAAAGGSTTITATIGGANTDANVDGATGNLTTKDGQALYLDGSGNLTTNNAGGLGQATIDDLTTAIATDTDGVDKITMGGTTFTSNTATLDVTGATISSTAFDALNEAFTTSTGYTVAAGADGVGTVKLTSNSANVNFRASDSTLTTDASTTTTTTYYEQANGIITDGQGAQLYKDAGGTLTFDATTAGDNTEDPLKVLDAALNQVDSLRSNMGAIQNRFDSAITNMQTNQNNLSSARSRIEDADYAVEVANMTRAQILQQAGTSVLAQANQMPQSVLSLLG
ncbi:flagellin N-terminal helical domain-containing protein [Zobellella maritima]|uniref:flagellin N-terminal helical domain-containing protein n=1 Tax=Zobellella maritima TaxID=2059725 RepID=UPI000E30091B|nr:flagellin [Zobellella maritima]